MSVSTWPVSSSCVIAQTVGSLVGIHGRGSSVRPARHSSRCVRVSLAHRRPGRGRPRARCSAGERSQGEIDVRDAGRRPRPIAAVPRSPAPTAEGPGAARPGRRRLCWRVRRAPMKQHQAGGEQPPDTAEGPDVGRVAEQAVVRAVLDDVVPGLRRWQSPTALPPPRYGPCAHPRPDGRGCSARASALRPSTRDPKGTDGEGSSLHRVLPVSESLRRRASRRAGGRGTRATPFRDPNGPAGVDPVRVGQSCTRPAPRSQRWPGDLRPAIRRAQLLRRDTRQGLARPHDACASGPRPHGRPGMLPRRQDQPPTRAASRCERSSRRPSGWSRS